MLIVNDFGLSPSKSPEKICGPNIPKNSSVGPTWMSREC